MSEHATARFSVRAVACAVVGVALASGCMTATMQARARQPNPLKSAKPPAQSARLHINVRDAELPHYVLRNTAFFSVVSRDRLRFHVSLVHKWREMADVSGWEAWLEDDKGRRFDPEAKEVRYVRHRTRMTDIDRRSTYRVNPDDYGSDIILVRNDAWKRRVPLASVDLFMGEGDYVFAAPDIMGSGVRRLTLVMRRAGMEMRYMWEFSDQGPVMVQNYGERANDPNVGGQHGRVLLQGPLTGYR